MWNLLILDPMVNLLLWLYGIFWDNYLLAILLLTILIRTLTWPLTWSQVKSTSKMQEFQPEMAKLREKYKDDPEALNRETMKLYQEAGINPVGGCLPTLVQLPILIGLYQAITNSLASSPLQLINLSQHIYHNLPPFISFLPDSAALLPLQSRVLWLDLAKPDPFYILTILVVLTTILQQRLLTPPSTDPAQQSMTRSMMLVMPLMVGFYSAIFPSGLSIYWIAGNVIGITQYAAMGRASLKNLFGTEDGSFSLQGLLGLGGPEEDTASSSRARPTDRKRKSRKRRA